MSKINQLWSRQEPFKKSEEEVCFSKSQTTYWVHLLRKTSNSTQSLSIDIGVKNNETLIKKLHMWSYQRPILLLFSTLDWRFPKKPC